MQLYVAVRLLDYCVQFWDTRDQKNVNQLERLKKKTQNSAKN